MQQFLSRWHDQFGGGGGSGGGGGGGQEQQQEQRRQQRRRLQDPNDLKPRSHDTNTANNDNNNDNNNNDTPTPTTTKTTTTTTTTTTNTTTTSSSSSITHYKWFSQAGQDHLVWNLLGQLEGGFFVDLAANDATRLSNTYSLERYHNWTGLCMEPNPKYWPRLVYRERCQVVGAVVGQSYMEEIEFQFGPAGSDRVVLHAPDDEPGVFGGIVHEEFDNQHVTTLQKLHPQYYHTTTTTSTRHQQYYYDAHDIGHDHDDYLDGHGKDDGDSSIVAKRFTVPLTTILDRYLQIPRNNNNHDNNNNNHTTIIIDYFSLDVEGAEGYILSSFDFSKYKIRILTVERPKPDLQQLLHKQGYRFLQHLGDFGEEVWYHESESERIAKYTNKEEPAGATASADPVAFG